MPSLATFNANNFFLRYQFPNVYPGDTSQKSLVEAGEVGLVGYVPGRAFGDYDSRWIVWDAARRRLAARALSEPDNRLPHIVCFQDVENIHATRIFNERYLDNHYQHSRLIDSYDERNIDVGLLSVYQLRDVRSHIDDTNNQGDRTFSRDCLEVEVELPGGEFLALLINHLNSKFVRRRANETDAHYNNRILQSHQKRLAQADEVVRYIDERFQGQQMTALYAVIGDLNDTHEGPWVAPLFNTPRLTDMIRRHRPSNDLWTYYYRSPNRVSHIDHVLASRALRDRIDAVAAVNPDRRPHIERQGLAFRALNASGQVLPRESNLVHFEAGAVTPMPATATPTEKVDFRFPRYTEVLADWRANVSDHCPVRVWF